MREDRHNVCWKNCRVRRRGISFQGTSPSIYSRSHQSLPNIKGERTRLTSIPGQPPDLLRPPPACRFNPRCPYVMDVCKKLDPSLEKSGRGDHLVACHLYD